MKHLLTRIGPLALLAALAASCAKTDEATPTVDTSNDNLLLDNPSGAVSNPSSPTNYLLLKPQYAGPNNNQQTWGNLEDYCRKLVGQGNKFYIICGSYGRGGTGSTGYQTTVASGKITLPSNCWKVVVVLPVGSDDVGRVTSSTRVIAIDTIITA